MRGQKEDMRGTHWGHVGVHFIIFKSYFGVYNVILEKYWKQIIKKYMCARVRTHLNEIKVEGVGCVTK